MKISCIAQKIKKSAALSEKFIFKTHTIAALTGIKVSVGNTITLSSTNLSAGIIITVPGKIESVGEIVLPGNLFFQVISAFDDNDQITLEAVEGQCIISSTKTRTVLPTLYLGDFPSIPKTSGHEFEYDLESLFTGIKSVSFSALGSDIKPELSSVYWYESEKQSVFVATDAFRLAEKKIHTTKNIDHTPCLIPLKNIPDFLRILSEYTGSAVFHQSPNQLSITHKDFYYTTRLVQGNYPSYEVIIPKNFETKVVINKSEVVKTLRATQIFHDRFNQVKMVINSDLSQISFTVNHSERGEMVTHIPAKITGIDVEMIIHQKNLGDVLNIIDDETIEINVVNHVKPIMIKGVQEKDFLYIMMPINRV